MCLTLYWSGDIWTLIMASYTFVLCLSHNGFETHFSHLSTDICTLVLAWQLPHPHFYVHVDQNVCLFAQ